MKRVLSYLKAYKGLLIIGLCLAVFSQFLSVMIPVITSVIANMIQEGMKSTMDFDGIIVAVIIGLCVTAGYFISNSIQNRLISKSVICGVSDIRKDLHKKLDRIALNYYDTHASGDVVSRATVDVTTISEAYADNFANLLSHSIMLIICFIVMIIINWALTICVVATALIGMIISNIIMKKSEPLFRKKADSIGEMNAQIDECFNGHLVIKAFNSEAEITEKFKAITKNVKKDSRKASLLTAVLAPISTFFSNLGFVAVCVVGAFLMLQPNPIVSLGVIVAFIMFVTQFSTALSSVLESIAAMQPSMAASKRVFELMDQEEMKQEISTHVEAGVGRVDFEHVKFGYNPDRIIIHDFSAVAYPGYKIAIVGPTGAGKSTLVNLLMRFYELNGGIIKIDGTNIQDISRDNLHNMIGMVLQETWTFEGTLRDNIVYSTKNVTDEQVNAVIDEVGLRPFVDSLPEGLDTVISEQSSISAGQKQLITIARVMIENAPIIILDEATSSIDTKTELLIQKAIDTLTHGRTSFVIAHRLSTIKNANLIFVMKDGDVVDIGDHDQLMAKGGLYADLYNSQFD